jgi:5S rRNA maturation endonuclease (ribonuclease M5)
MRAYELVTGALDLHGSKHRGRDWTCPTHEDDDPSLSVSDAGDRVLLKCQAGCETADIVAALRLEMSDLFDEKSVTPPKHITGTYPYVDEEGRLLFEVVRFHPKDFRQRRPDGNGGDVWRLDGVRRVLYRLPQVMLAARKGKRVYVVEGEKDVHAIEAAGAVATCNPGGAGKWRKEYAEALRGAEVVVVADRDDPGRKHARQVVESLYGIAVRVELVEPADGKDAVDHLAAGHGLEDFAPSTADAPATVAAARPLAEILADIEGYVRRFVVLSDAQAVAVTLWIVHVFAFAAASTTIYLIITSATMRCGKSRLLEVLEALLGEDRCVFTMNVSPPALYRTIHAHPGTAMLMDEQDRTLNGNRERAQELFGLINSGFRRRGGVAIRMSGQGANLQTARFRTFSPKALCGLGVFPDTVRDRGVEVRMRRKLTSERVERFREADAQTAVPIREALVVWANTDTLARLEAARPALPSGLNDRAQDGWEPLLAIADAAGDVWPEVARAAAVDLHDTASDYAEEGLELLALRHVREAFAAKEDPEAMWTVDLLKALVQRDDAPWAGWWGEAVEHERTQSPAQRLGRLLGAWVKPRDVRIGDVTRRGYRRGDLADAWARHLETAATAATAATPQVAPTSDVAPVAPVAAPTRTEAGYLRIQRDQGETPPAFDSEALANVARAFPGVRIVGGAA